jgi:hypothetical protein
MGESPASLSGVLICEECGRVSSGNAEGWQAVLADDPRDHEPTEVAVYCPECASSEFGEGQFTRWELWRQDDNGHRFIIARSPNRRKLEGFKTRLEAGGHKQTYWITRGATESDSPSPRCG